MSSGLRKRPDIVPPKPRVTVGVSTEELDEMEGGKNADGDSEEVILPLRDEEDSDDQNAMPSSSPKSGGSTPFKGSNSDRLRARPKKAAPKTRPTVGVSTDELLEMEGGGISGSDDGLTLNQVDVSVEKVTASDAFKQVNDKRQKHEYLQELSRFNGCWVHGDIQIAEIDNGILRWRLSDDYEKHDEQVTVNGKGDLVLTIEGELLTGRLVNSVLDPSFSTIEWSDGDIWRRDITSERDLVAEKNQQFAQFNGCWMQASDDTPIAQIENGILRWRLSEEYIQEELNVTVNDKGELVIADDENVLTGQIINGEILWSDGDWWRRDTESELIAKYNGIWYQDDQKVAEVKDESLTWLVAYDMSEDFKTEVRVLRSGKIEMNMDNELFTGQLIQGVLVWNDGTIWTKAPGVKRPPSVGRSSPARAPKFAAEATSSLPPPEPDETTLMKKSPLRLPSPLQLSPAEHPDSPATFKSPLSITPTALPALPADLQAPTASPYAPSSLPSVPADLQETEKKGSKVTL